MEDSCFSQVLYHSHETVLTQRRDSNPPFYCPKANTGLTYAAVSPGSDHLICCGSSPRGPISPSRSGTAEEQADDFTASCTGESRRSQVCSQCKHQQSPPHFLWELVCPPLSRSLCCSLSGVCVCACMCVRVCMSECVSRSAGRPGCSLRAHITDAELCNGPAWMCEIGSLRLPHLPVLHWYTFLLSPVQPDCDHQYSHSSLAVITSIPSPAWFDWEYWLVG